MSFKFLFQTDHTIIRFLKKYNGPLARTAIFIVFFWFGALKIIGQSPANPLVADLLTKTLPFITFNTFIILFGIFEMIIGALFLIPNAERVAILFLVVHMITTILPLILLRSVTWNGFLIPTLEGQYIIKNIAIIALAAGVAAHLHPMKQ
ncbi:MAG: hypothetical protein EXS55_00470 [Candidatus Magasanikbacteria bacterium]|nr:hypothetical protein [Candidatus Magasanikbacteria bacterium]